METLFTFLVNASTGIILFYLVYWFFLRKETFYTGNRWFLVGALLFAVLLPFFPVHYSVLVEPDKNSTVFETMSNAFKNAKTVDSVNINSLNFKWEQILLVIYLTGAAIFLLRLFTQTFVLIHLMIKYSIKSLDGIRIVENEKYGLPFSFFNVVFINPKFHTQDDLPEILAHEKVHIRENHWFDLLFIELLTVIFWFNPFIWFFERSIKQNHEYLADKSVLSNGHSVSRYQAILVNQLMGMQIIGITNNLNFALNANRLKMMTKKKTPKIKGYKFVWALPAIALLLFAFAEPTYQVKEAETIIENSFSILQKGEKEFVIHGKVIEEETGEPLPGASIIIKGTPIGTVSDRDGTFTLIDPNPTVDANTGALSSEIVVSFVGFETLVNKISEAGNATENNKYTFKMKEGVIYASACFADYEILPPVGQESKNEKLAPPPPPPPPSVDGKEVFYIVEELPAFPGGSEALTRYVYGLTKKQASKNNLKGRAKIGFTVNARGKVTDVKIVEADKAKIGKAAANIIGTLPNWKPGSQRGKNVKVNFIIAMEFK